MSPDSKNKCAATELKMLGDFWTLQIIQSLADGQKRFSELERTLPGINPTTLTARLRKLMRQKIVLRNEETVDKISVVYSLTAKGKGILPVLAEIRVFADKYLR